MRVIAHRNVNRAYGHGLWLLQTEGIHEETRNGPVLAFDQPITNVYYRPDERVLFSPARDANPFFHIAEAIWMLAGSNNGRFLDRFIHDFSSRFGESDGHIHGAYGYRWRHHFEMEGGGEPGDADQLLKVIHTLRKDAHTRQAVLTMWDPVSDLGISGLKDRPCNTHVYFRVHTNGMLDMTVLCRSNDAVWGTYGANVVHFSILHEFVAAMIGAKLGTYRQVSHNFHVYQWYLDKFGKIDERHEYGKSSDLYTQYDTTSTKPKGPLVAPSRMFHKVTDPALALEEFEHWLEDPEGRSSYGYCQPILTEVAIPMVRAHKAWKEKDHKNVAHNIEWIGHTDWRTAASNWLARRTTK